MSAGPAVPTTGVKLTQLYVHLWDYATTTIPSNALANIQKIFGGLRSKGYQALLRFAYDDGVRPDRHYTVQPGRPYLGTLDRGAVARPASGGCQLSVWRACVVSPGGVTRASQRCGRRVAGQWVRWRTAGRCH
ncbi:DUF4874 domain-containing protein [Streptomyces sp. NPDC001107]